MAIEERLIILKNVTDKDIHETWDAIPHAFPAHQEVVLAYGKGLHFRDKYPLSLQVIQEKVGIAPEAIAVEVFLVNPSTDPESVIRVQWDGRVYEFKPGEPVKVDSSMVRTLVEQARHPVQFDGTKGGKLEVTTVPETGPDHTPESEEAPEPQSPQSTPEALPVAPRAKRPSRSKKSATEPAE